MALAFNAEYPEAEGEITASDDFAVYVTTKAFEDRDRVWRWRIVVTPGVFLADGGFAAASSPEVQETRRYPREKPLDVARRVTRSVIGRDPESMGARLNHRHITY
jgi:hypothetical protein